MFPLTFSEVQFTWSSISTNEYPEKKNNNNNNNEKWYYKEAWKSYTKFRLEQKRSVNNRITRYKFTNLNASKTPSHVRVALLFDAVHVSAANGSKCTIKYEYLALDRLFFPM